MAETPIPAPAEAVPYEDPATRVNILDKGRGVQTPSQIYAEMTRQVGAYVSMMAAQAPHGISVSDGATVEVIDGPTAKGFRIVLPKVRTYDHVAGEVAALQVVHITTEKKFASSPMIEVKGDAGVRLGYRVGQRVDGRGQATVSITEQESQDDNLANQERLRLQVTNVAQTLDGILKRLAAALAAKSAAAAFAAGGTTNVTEVDQGLVSASRPSEGSHAPSDAVTPIRTNVSPLVAAAAVAEEPIVQTGEMVALGALAGAPPQVAPAASSTAPIGSLPPVPPPPVAAEMSKLAALAVTTGAEGGDRAAVVGWPVSEPSFIGSMPPPASPVLPDEAGVARFDPDADPFEAEPTPVPFPPPEALPQSRTGSVDRALIALTSSGKLNGRNVMDLGQLVEYFEQMEGHAIQKMVPAHAPQIGNDFARDIDGPDSLLMKALGILGRMPARQGQLNSGLEIGFPKRPNMARILAPKDDRKHGAITVKFPSSSLAPNPAGGSHILKDLRWLTTDVNGTSTLVDEIVFGLRRGEDGTPLAAVIKLMGKPNGSFVIRDLKELVIDLTEGGKLPTQDDLRRFYLLWRSLHDGLRFEFVPRAHLPSPEEQR